VAEAIGPITMVGVPVLAFGSVSSLTERLWEDARKL
jgi:hypothetical protein